MLCLLEVKRKTKVLTFDNKTLVNIISKFEVERKSSFSASNGAVVLS
jgi:hypothetical protein